MTTLKRSTFHQVVGALVCSGREDLAREMVVGKKRWSSKDYAYLHNRLNELEKELKQEKRPDWRKIIKQEISNIDNKMNEYDR